MFLEIKHTNIGYNKPLISNIEATLDLGEVCLLIGNNGVGKTTLIKSILKQIPTLQGEIKINYQNIQSLSVKDIAEKIAIVFSKAPIPTNYTVSDLIGLGKFIHYPYYFELSNNDKQEVKQIIKDLNLEEFENHQLKDLSDGNLQKAFIGRAIAQNSPFIILDEPTAHLDEENKIIILKLLRKLAHDYQKLILFSSHDWRLAKEFSDKVWYIKNQQLFSGITEDILTQHSDLLKPILFNFSNSFIPPSIIASNAEAEMLYSFLQKKHQKDLSSYNFEYKDSIWCISDEKNQYFASNFEEIHQILSIKH